MPGVLPSLVGASFADIASALSFGASNLIGTMAGEALERVLKGRAERARAIFIEELKDGLRSPNDSGEIDEFVAVLYRYMRAAQEGAARLNLRLMARVIRSQIEHEGLYASEFLRHAELISSLSREEVILLATRHRLRSEFDKAKQSENWTDTRDVNKQVEDGLIPTVFATRLELNAAMTALQRTGLIWPGAAAVSGGFVWQDTPLMDRIVKLAQFENVLEEEHD